MSCVLFNSESAGDDADDLEMLGEQSDDCISCIESVALSYMSMLHEAEGEKVIDRFRARVSVWSQQLEVSRTS